MNIDWTFVLNCTVMILCFLVTLADFLQGGAAWPFVVFVVWAVAVLVLAGLVALGVLR